MKKLKIVGTPLKVNRNTAFIEGMFNSDLEVAKFEGAGIKTVSGIRGTIKKAAKMPGKKGVARCTFEDKILYKDIVFTRSWVQVEVPKFYNQIGEKLLTTSSSAAAVNAAKDKSTFIPLKAFDGRKEGFVFKTGNLGLGYYLDDSQKSENGAPDGAQVPIMKTVAQLRRESNMGAPVNRDSLYLPIERVKRVFNPLQVPQKLQASLPYSSKPKLEKKRKRKSLDARRAVVPSSDEKKAYTLMQQLQTIRNDKAAKKKAKRAEALERAAKRKPKEEAWREELQKAERKKRYILQGQAAKRDQKRMSRG